MKNIAVGKKLLLGFLAVILMIAVIIVLTVITSLTRNHDLEQSILMSQLQTEANNMIQELDLARGDAVGVYTGQF